MTEFGPNKTKGQYFCLRITLLLLVIVLLAFASSFILFLSQRKVLHYVTTNDTTSGLTFQHSNSVRCSLVAGEANTADDAQSNGKTVIVETATGKVEGVKRKVFGSDLNIFIGIPYAEPPIGDLRFKRTVPVKPWSDTMKTTAFRPNCVQYFDERIAKMFTVLNFEMSEDCLYLNIWTPKVNNKTDLKPVMVWIHGGSFSEGSVNIDENDGQVLASYGQVVVITFNYRVGALGFFDLGVDDSPGNQGLYDQAMALRWIKENIENFGGDSNKITLFGVSAGAMSIGLHMVSPQSKHLFKRAILQSGSPVVVSAYYSNTGTTAQQLSEILGCVSSYGTNEDEDENDNIDMLPVHKEPQKVLNCLRTKSVQNFIKAQEQIATNATLSFTPSPYEEFLPIMPTDAIKEKIVGESFSNIHEVLMGLTKDEASVFLHLHAPQIFTEHNVTIDFNSIEELHDLFIEIVVKRNVPLSQAQILASTFLRPDSPEKDNVKRLYTALSDLAFNCPATIFAQELAKSNKTVYFYIFNHRLSGVPQIADWMGVPHLTLMPFVFGYPLRYPTRFSGADIEVSKRIMKAWTKFAESGKMPPQSGVEWKKFSLENQEYLEITERTSTLKEKYHEKSCELFKVGFDTLESK